ncbi:MAG: hypothetical protein WC509_00065 [Candidatus Izemoplasmatales bacterium]
MRGQGGVNSTSKSVRLKYLPNIILTSALAIISITPYLSRNFSLQINFGIFLLWGVSAIITNDIHFSFVKMDKIIVWTVAWAIMQYVMRATGVSNLIWKVYIDRLTLYFIPVIMVFILSYYNFAEMKLLASIFVYVIILNTINNISLYITDPTIFINLNILGDISRLTNAGSTDFVTLLIFFIGVCVVAIINTTKIAMKIMFIAFSLCAGYFVVYGNPRATAFVFLSLLLFAILALSYRNSNSFSVLLRGLCILLILILVFIEIVPIVRFVTTSITSSRMIERFNDIVRIVEGNTSFLNTGNESIALRFQLAQTSISTFFGGLSNFIYGVGEKVHGESFFELVNYGVGDHSELIDVFAEYGIIGGFILYNLLYEIFKKILALPKSKIIKRQLLAIIAVFILYSFFNDVLLENVLYVVYIFMPIMIVVLDERNTKGHIRGVLHG